MARDILIVDDEADIRELVAGILSDEGYDTRVAADSDSALRAIAQRHPSVLLLDIWLHGSRLDGLEILDQVHQQTPELPIIMISGHGNVETAVSAMKRGAYDFIEKPFKSDQLSFVVARALEASRLRRENRALRKISGDEPVLIGKSGAMSSVRSLIKKVSASESRVMISGPAGSGKEVAARLLHHSSSRKSGSFVVINAANLAPERLEMALFGVDEGGDDTKTSRIGYFEQAHGGTLFIDEVAEMPAETQSKILRVLVDQSFQRVGGSTPVEVDVRVISATSRDLRSEIESGRFREDLFHRLSVIPVAMPPLTERLEDVPLLVEHFIERISESSGLPVRELDAAALTALQTYDWPGNVRQLRNVVEQLLILSSDQEGPIGVEILPAELQKNGTAIPISENGGEIMMSQPLREARVSFERTYLSAQIKRFGGNISRTAAFVGMERSALHRKLKSLGISSSGRTHA